MGQKVHPTGIRLGIIRDHNSIWYAGRKNYAQQLISDLSVREYLQGKLASASVSRIVIERPGADRAYHCPHCSPRYRYWEEG